MVSNLSQLLTIQLFPNQPRSVIPSILANSASKMKLIDMMPRETENLSKLKEELLMYVKKMSEENSSTEVLLKKIRDMKNSYQDAVEDFVDVYKEVLETPDVLAVWTQEVKSIGRELRPYTDKIKFRALQVPKATTRPFQPVHVKKFTDSERAAASSLLLARMDAAGIGVGREEPESNDNLMFESTSVEGDVTLIHEEMKGTTLFQDSDDVQATAIHEELYQPTDGALFGHATQSQLSDCDHDDQTELSRPSNDDPAGQAVLSKPIAGDPVRLVTLSKPSTADPAGQAKMSQNTSGIPVGCTPLYQSSDGVTIVKVDLHQTLEDALAGQVVLFHVAADEPAGGDAPLYQTSDGFPTGPIAMHQPSDADYGSASNIALHQSSDSGIGISDFADMYHHSQYGSDDDGPNDGSKGIRLENISDKVGHVEVPVSAVLSEQPYHDKPADPPDVEYPFSDWQEDSVILEPPIASIKKPPDKVYTFKESVKFDGRVTVMGC